MLASYNAGAKGGKKLCQIIKTSWYNLTDYNILGENIYKNCGIKCIYVP